MSWTIMTSTVAANCCAIKGDPRKLQLSWSRLELIRGCLKSVPDTQLHDGELMTFANSSKVRGSFYCYFDCADGTGYVLLTATRDLLIIGVTRASEVDQATKRYDVSKKIGFHDDQRGEW